jgi:hypothetical protein
MSCKCQECGNSYKIDLLVSNEIWERIKPYNKPKGAGLLCGSCILKKMENILSYDAYKLLKI